MELYAITLGLTEIDGMDVDTVRTAWLPVKKL